MTELDVSPFPGDIRFRQFFDAVDELDKKLIIRISAFFSYF